MKDNHDKSENYTLSPKWSINKQFRGQKVSHGYKSTGANLLEEIGILLTFYSLGLVNIC